MLRGIVGMGAVTEALMEAAYASLRERFAPSSRQHALLSRIIVEERAHWQTMLEVARDCTGEEAMTRSEVAFLQVQHEFVGRLLSVLDGIQRDLPESEAFELLLALERDVGENVLPRIVASLGGQAPLEELLRETGGHGDALATLREEKN